MRSEGIRHEEYGRLFSLMGFSSYVFLLCVLTAPPLLSEPLRPCAPRERLWRAAPLRSFSLLCVRIIKRIKSVGDL